MIDRRSINTYFQALLDELREQHNFTTARKVQSRCFHTFASGFTGIKYVAGFNKAGTVYTKLLIRFGDYETTKNFFDTLKERESEINTKFDALLHWDRCDGILKSQVYIDRNGNIETSTSELEAIRAWHLENLLKFKEVFTPEIQHAREILQSSDLEN